jgi:mannose-6-phosphate isomerase-like protein (cupin superfamily)
METTAQLDKASEGTAAMQEPMRLLKSFFSETTSIPGRRPFFKYRDLGVEVASNGRMRANQSSSIAGMLEQTGWHYHECEMQFVYVFRGEVVIEFEDGTVATFRAGDAMFIPGGVRHNEVYVSEDKESIEVSLPAKMGTVNCERPAGLPEKLTPVSSAYQPK